MPSHPNHRPTRRRTRVAAAGALLAAPALAACTASSADDGLDVLASFYPLQYVAEQVGGEHVSVSSLTPPAAEPHDLELSPAQVRAVGESDLVVYLSGMQAATDEAVEAQAPERVVDSADAAGLEHGPNGGGAAALDAGALDPHFWLDPTRLAAVGHDVADELAAADPDHAADYAANADALEAELVALDGDYRDGLAQCAGATLVVSHEAFGYLAERYDLVQEGISGLDPEVEPSPARLREVGAIVRQNDVETLYFEVLTSPKVTTTLAEDLGVGAAKLDPIEGWTEGSDYMDIMRENLTALREGLNCRS
ncbi:metal ABC transporter substrate-binding protein [Isoptericola sp. BMS4]|uniref:metal ABC transporter substrate-binding protein n=1 Tax=Isoptericola sp. BMS4 TaxID=2527875 RepID=UPI00141FFA3F|nr:metal ABC transporter substrate-binding protein [Isoptericola sp. BMS4]